MIVLSGNFPLYDTLGGVVIFFKYKNIPEIWNLVHVDIDMKKIHKVVKFYWHQGVSA